MADKVSHYTASIFHTEGYMQFYDQCLHSKGHPTIAAAVSCMYEMKKQHPQWKGGKVEAVLTSGRIRKLTPTERQSFLAAKARVKRS